MADHFDDVYFSNDSGIDETQHVFIDGNDLKTRWQNWTEYTFVIAETGFGTGLNFLVAMHEFQKFREANPSHPLKRLVFLTTEKYPLPQSDMQRALAAFPALLSEATALANVYPMGLEGCHRLQFDTFSTTLDLWIGDVHTLLPQWQSPRNGLVDAWFLDGFAPSKNPDMWTGDLFSQMARLSKTGTTFGTFTAAGIVKRGLANVGFTIAKRNGFGRKRDMLTGVFSEVSENVPHKLRQPQGPYYRYGNPTLTTESSVIVVGSGLAAASVCLSLANRGIATTLYFEEAELAAGASGNPQGGFYPQLHSEASIASRIQAHSFLYAKQCYEHIVQEYPQVAHEFCGVIQLSFNDKVAERQNKLADSDVWPEDLVAKIDSNTVSEIANIALPYSGLLIKEGGWLSPPHLVDAMVRQAKKTGNLTIKAGHRYVSHSLVDNPKSVAERVNAHFIHDTNETIQSASHIILAPGAGAVGLSEFDSLSLRPVRGQVEAIPTQAPIASLQTVLCHKGYMTPSLNERHALGSTYVKNDMATDIRGEETDTNLATHSQALANTDIVGQLKHDGMARAATRLGSPDHQPVVGALHDFTLLKADYSDLGVGKPLETVPTLPASAVSALTCLGSRGLTTAPLMAEVLVSSLCNQPLPMSNDLLNAVNTSRFMTREAIRGI